jgi:hypothetical protein
LFRTTIQPRPAASQFPALFAGGIENGTCGLAFRPGPANLCQCTKVHMPPPRGGKVALEIQSAAAYSNASMVWPIGNAGFAV